MKQKLVILIALIISFTSFAQRPKQPVCYKAWDAKNEIKNSKQLEESIFRNLEIDTTKIFGIWTQDPTAPFADFHITAKSFNILNFDSENDIPYMLDKKQISFFYKGNRHTGIIISTKNDSLKIKWTDIDFETKYVRFEN